MLSIWEIWTPMTKNNCVNSSFIFWNDVHLMKQTWS